MIVGVPRETAPGERRVALVPDLVGRLARPGVEVRVEPGAGEAAGFPDAAYQDKGAKVAPDPLRDADVALVVAPPGPEQVARLKEGAVLVGLLAPYTNAAGIRALAARRVTAFAMELMPRITRAQPMDALSAMSTVSGYKAVLIAANHLPKFFPLLMTAAGTLTAAKVFVIGAGVAGLQAIGTARRLGAVMEAYDTRPVVKEQVQSLGAKFVELDLQAQDAQAATGYAREQSEEFYRRQRELLGQRVAASDVVITTALVPGKRAPLLITEEAVRGMRPGSVVVDLAAEQGGNCALTEPGKDVVRHSVVVCGPLNLPATMPQHASQMYARTVSAYLGHLLKDGSVRLDLSDELTRGPLLTHNGEVVHEAGKAALAAAGQPS
jgi:NAD(P) transhydrogenase subunit alpha